MIDYTIGNEIRRKYPKRLSRKHIDSIIKEWSDIGIEQEWMLKYASIFNMSLYQLNISEKELALRATMHFNLAYLKEEEFYGMLASTNFRDLVGCNENIPKKEYKLRLTIGKEFLDKCKEINVVELSRGLNRTWEIQKQVREKYPRKTNSYEEIIDELVQEYIL